MSPTGAVLAVLVAATVAAIAVLASHPEALGSRKGKALAFLIYLVLPVAVSGVGAMAHMEKAKETEFCLSCHVMKPYGESLGYDDAAFVPAVHYQNNLVPRERACFTCHTTYTLFGDVKAKLNGLRHVWVYYSGQVPEKISLYQPYSNRECLNCHAPARSFLEGGLHADVMPALLANETSCKECHDQFHDVANLAAHAQWKGAPGKGAAP
jgi:nitrate/TMAO reductase-like tetraheme cytochrome c subunit